MEKDLTTTNIFHVDDFRKQVTNELESATKNAEDVAQLLDRVSSLAQFKCKFGDKILLLINHILKRHGHELKPKSEYESTEDLCNTFDNVVDELGRKIDNHLLEAQGKKAIEDDPNIKTLVNNKEEPSATNSISTRKSQAFFKIAVDNSATPFVPQIFEKPNALMPLEESMRKDREMFGHPHPYQFELDNFTPGEELLAKVVPTRPKDLNSTPLIHVDTEEQLNEVIDKLRRESEIAVDLEHHSFRSYLGFTCLMQISTRDEDFIIDTLSLRHLIHKLNVVFTDPRIVKVLHGSDFDVIWLQKDFGVYLVNTFDTGLAARALKFPSYSYAYVLDNYCKVKADKQYQLADWRVRPLPVELVKYAREDTHYLLYIYDRMRNDLIKENNGFHGLLSTVVQNSTNLCKKRYEKPNVKENSHLDLLKTSKSSLSARQVELLRKLYDWRDGMARENDESTGFVLPNQKLLTIVKNMPKEIGGVIACLDQSKFGSAESIYRIITSVSCLPDSYFDGSSKEDKSNSQVSLDTNPQQDLNSTKNVDGIFIDMRGINNKDYEQEDLIVAALKNISVNSSPRKPLSQIQNLLTKQPKMSEKFQNILNRMINPYIMYWPDSFLAETGCVQDTNISFTMKPHTNHRSNSKLPAQPEVIQTKPVMLLDDSKNVDNLLKSVRTQIHESEAPKRKADESLANDVKKKKKTNAEVQDESNPTESHQYDPKEWQDMIEGKSDSTKKSFNRDNKKRKSDDSQHEINKKLKLPYSSRSTKSMTFFPKDNRNNSQQSTKPLPSAPRIPWPSKK